MLNRIRITVLIALFAVQPLLAQAAPADVDGDGILGPQEVIDPSQNWKGPALPPGGVQPWQIDGTIIFYNGGKVGIGTNTPGERLTVAGDAEIGTGHGDYRHLRIGGGNSSGFLCGSSLKYADGIHLGYNYYADVSGANWVIQPDGTTSRITVGYGFLTLATGGVGQPPVDRLMVDSVGNVRLGANTQLSAPGGEENLRILRGTVDKTGAILAGSGFTATRTTSSRYSIVFDTPLPSPPSVTITANFTQTDGPQLDPTSGIASTDFAVRVSDFFIVSPGTGRDRGFNFIAAGP